MQKSKITKEPSSFKSKVLVGMFDEPTHNQIKFQNNTSPPDMKQRQRSGLTYNSIDSISSISKIKKIDFDIDKKNFEIVDVTQSRGLLQKRAFTENESLKSSPIRPTQTKTSYLPFEPEDKIQIRGSQPAKSGSTILYHEKRNSQDNAHQSKLMNLQADNQQLLDSHYNALTGAALANSNSKKNIYNGEIARLRGLLDQRNHELAKLDSQVGTMNDKRDIQSTLVKKKIVNQEIKIKDRGEVQKLRDQLDNLRLQYENLKDDVKRGDRKIYYLEEELQSHQKTYDSQKDMENEVLKLQKDIAKWRSKFITQNHHFSEVEEQMTLKEAELDNLKKATKKTVTSSSTSIKKGEKKVTVQEEGE